MVRCRRHRNPGHSRAYRGGIPLGWAGLGYRDIADCTRNFIGVKKQKKSGTSQIRNDIPLEWAGRKRPETSQTRRGISVGEEAEEIRDIAN